MASVSAWSVAKVFGDISPKIRIRTVKIPVATPAPTLPNSRSARVVAMLDAERFTMLLPINMALSILPESSVIFRARAARLFPSSASVSMRMRLKVVREVSAEEKNAERNSNTANTINWNMSSELNGTPLISG